MSFEKTSRDPFIDGKSNHFNKFSNSCFIFSCGIINSFEELERIRFKRVLIHPSNNIELNDKEIKN